jgi:hypothetical protein
MALAVPKWLFAARWLSKGVFFGSIVVFIATHDLTPGENPGGFGDGYRNLVHIIFPFGPLVLIGLIGWAWSSSVIRSRQDGYY